MNIKILLNFHGKHSKKKFREIDLFDFTSFFVWTCLNFLARCVSCGSRQKLRCYFYSLKNLHHFFVLCGGMLCGCTFCFTVFISGGTGTRNRPKNGLKKDLFHFLEYLMIFFQSSLVCCTLKK